jgi:hypothetical protein
VGKTHHESAQPNLPFARVSPLESTPAAPSRERHISTPAAPSRERHIGRQSWGKYHTVDDVDHVCSRNVRGLLGALSLPWNILKKKERPFPISEEFSDTDGQLLVPGVSSYSSPAVHNANVRWPCTAVSRARDLDTHVKPRGSCHLALSCYFSFYSILKQKQSWLGVLRRGQ